MKKSPKDASLTTLSYYFAQDQKPPIHRGNTMQDVKTGSSGIEWNLSTTITTTTTTKTTTTTMIILELLR